MMQTLTAQYQIVTPMFIGSANRDDPPEIRPPSIKGALRFWWRTLHWGSCLKQTQGNTDAALQALHRQEAELFGAAVRDEKYGQGLCAIKLKQVQLKGEENNWPKNNDAGAGFLGYGLDKTQSGDPHRKSIAQGNFTISLLLKSKISAEQIQQLENTLLVWGLLGGLGSRARRGFGSVAITQLNDQTIEFKQSQNYYDKLKQLLDKRILAPSMPVFTALNQSISLVDGGRNSNYKLLMNQLGAGYKQARINAGKGLKKLPFGLPLAGKGKDGDEQHRRSSPLLMHIHPVGSTYQAIISFIPAVFHPQYPEGNQLDFYQPIQSYLQTMECIYP